MNYETIIGLEIHVELSTHTKMFCKCLLPTLTDKPNSKTCPVCLGLPGALPFANKKALDSCIKIALALNCQINMYSFFERKNYFYPDLAKGFQISQYLHPFGKNGFLNINDKGRKKRIGITRVHMEEDTGKLIHSQVNGKNVSLIDFNRSGVPLVEIVTEPDIRSGEEAKEFLTALQRIVRYLGISSADMEKGHMRLEPNISLRPIGQTSLPNYKVEVKNINSFKFVEKSIKHEELRQANLLSENKIPAQETRGWNEFRNETVSQRSKEEAHDYRYFPEPDIPPLEFGDSEINELRKRIPELPNERYERLLKDYKIKPYDAEIITREKSLAEFSEAAFEIGRDFSLDAQKISHFIINKKIDPKITEPAAIIKQIVSERKVEKIDEKKLNKVIDEVLNENKKAIEEFKSGKSNVIEFLLGITIRKYNSKVDANVVKDAILKTLNK